MQGPANQAVKSGKSLTAPFPSLRDSAQKGENHRPPTSDKRKKQNTQDAETHIDKKYSHKK